jgi:hypothetical protein
MRGTDAVAYRTKAVNILTFRRDQTRSLRAGNHLPFYKALEFFAMQRCCRPHDKVFGYLGLTNSRIPVDYSVSVLDLCVACLADYFLSAGLMTENLRQNRNVAKRQIPKLTAVGMVATFLAFDLDLFDPVVNLLFYEVAKFFAPGFEEYLYSMAMTSWTLVRNDVYDKKCIRIIEAAVYSERSTLITVGSFCFQAVKLLAQEFGPHLAKYKEISARQKALAQEDAVMTTGEDGESRKYSEWVAHAKAITEQMWQRFQESGEDAEGDLDDDEAWTLIA